MGLSVSTLKHAAKEKKATEAKSPKTTPAAAAKKDSAAVEAAKKKAAAARMRATEEAAAAVRAPAPSPEPTPATGAEETDAILRAEAVAAAKEERLLRRSRGGPTGGAGGAAETGEPGTKRTREEGRLYYREFEAAMGLLEWCGRFVHGGGAALSPAAGVSRLPAPAPEAQGVLGPTGGVRTLHASEGVPRRGAG